MPEELIAPIFADELTDDEIYYMSLDPQVIDKVCLALGIDKNSVKDPQRVLLIKVLSAFAGEAVDDSWSDYHASRA